MAITPMRGAGVNLPLNPGLYTPYTGPVFGNELNLTAGQTYLVPAGQWFITTGIYTFLQFYDPVTLTWRNLPNAQNTPTFISSDGVNFRLANLTGYAVGAVVTNGGSGYTSAPTVSISGNATTFRAVVGGAIAAPTVVTAGAGYNYPPTIIISPPPAGGVQALGYATLSSGVPSITITDYGAGYLSAPTISIVPDPREATAASPGPTTATVATTTITASAGKVTAVLATGFSAQTAVSTSLPALTFTGGGGSSAAATPVMCWSATGLTQVVAGVAYGTSLPTQARTLGGSYNFSVSAAVASYSAAAAGLANPSVSTGLFVPRQAQIGLVSSAGGALGTTQFGAATLIDAGLFQSIPYAYLGDTTFTAAPTTLATATVNVGSSPVDTTLIQPV